MMLRSLLALAGAVLVALLAPRASATPSLAPSVYVLAIGNNASPSGGADEAPLRYADDDAVSFYRFAKGVSPRGALLTVMDPETQARFPDEVAEARPPTLKELRAAVQELRTGLLEDRQRGVESTVLIFFSGHGNRPSGKPAGLALLDGSLTHEMLFEEVLAQLPARFVHLFVDACYAEAIVRPRDADAEHADLTDADLMAYAARSTLSRFPNVGTVMAATSSSQTHEWDVYRNGVFTHELLSGLRGGADVNGDHRVEYSELYAFLVAANREVPDERARVHVVARPPSDDARVAIVDLRAFHDGAVIAGVPASAGATYVEDERGDRLADIHVEDGSRAALVLPAGRRLFIHCRLGEGSVAALRPDETIAFDSIALVPAVLRVRGSIDLALRKGLFATAFGANYYRGFVDLASGFLSVTFADTEPQPGRSEEAGGAIQVIEASSQLAARPARALGNLFAAAGVGRGVARDLGAVPELQIGLRSPRATGWMLTLDVALARTPAYDEWHTIVTGGYRVGARKGRWSGAVGLAAGGGVIGQTVTGGSPLLTGAFAIEPVIGASCRLGERLDLAFEGDGSLLVYRRDWSTVASFLPAAFLGLVVHL
jgi:hypothetical protein